MRIRYLVICVGILLTSCVKHAPAPLQGYAEGEFVHVAAPFAGNLIALSVKRGQQVQAGAALFQLEQDSERAAQAEMQERLRRADAQLEDLKKGKRADEQAVVVAQLAQARAALRFSQSQLRREEKLIAQGFLSRARLDELRTQVQRDRARIAELDAQLRTARLAARPDAIAAAEAELMAAQAALDQAKWRVAQKTITAPVAGLVQDTNYVLGEWVPAGTAVVSLLPPANIKVRFFVPTAALGAVKLEQPVTVNCDGCAAPLAARVSYIAPQPEYTPPVIYSKENRAKLVFLVEASLAPADAVRLHPGQPVDVSLQ